MALFPDSEITDVTTPDGRTLRLPQSVLGGLQIGQTPGPAPAGFSDEQAAPVAEEIPSVTGGALPTPALQELPKPDVPIQSSPDVKVGTVDNRDATIAKSNKAYDTRQKAAAAQAASPMGQVDAVSGQQQQGIANEAQATTNVADIESAGLDMIGNAYKHRNEQILEFEKKRAADAQEQQQAEQKKAAEIGALRKKIGSTKIDRKADHPILAAISVALFELGSAMKGDAPGMGVKMLYDSIDRKVAGQMADLDQMAKTYGMSREELADLKESGKRKLEFHNMMIAAESDKAIRQIEEMTARTNSEKVKANAQILVSQLQQRAAGATMESLRWGLDYQQRERAEKNQNSRFYAGLNQQERFHKDDQQLKREEIYLDYQKSLAASKAKGDELEYKAKLDQIDKNNERGVGNIAQGGKPLMNQRGINMLKQADADEAEAKSLREIDAQSPDPAARQMAESRAKALEARAQQTRSDAMVWGQFQARSPVEAVEIGKKYSAAQSALTLIDDLKNLYDSPDGGKSYLKTDEGRAAIQTKLNQLNVALKDAWQAGAWDKGLATLMANTTGGDPTKGASVENLINVISGGAFGTDPEAFKGRLDSVANGLETDVYNQLRAAKWDVQDKTELFGRKKKPTETPEQKSVVKMQQSKTPLETESAAQSRVDSGFLSKGLYDLGHHLNKGIFDASAPATPEEARDRAANSGSLEYPGLSAEQGTQMGQLLKAYKAGNTRVGDALVQQAVDPSRPDLSIATFHALRDNAPDLYTKARAAVAPDSEIGKQLDYEEKSRIALTTTPIPMLVQQAANPDDTEAYRELARRASNGDPDAKKAVLPVIQARQRAKQPGGDPLGLSAGGK